MLIELFRQVLRLRRYERKSIENRFRRNGVISGKMGHPPRTILSVAKLDERTFYSLSLRILAEVSFVLSQFTRLIDRRTDGWIYDRKYRVA